MDIFITGATGYIGNRLAHMLANEGHTVHALCRSAGKNSLLQHSNIKVCKGDISSIDVLMKAMEGCSQVYHLAAFARVWAKDKSVYETINVAGTRNVLEAARLAGITDVVVTSTAGVLGPSGSRPVKENDQRIGDILNEYEATKTEAEHICRQYAEIYNMHVVMVNPPRVYGPGVESESNAVTKLARLYISGKWKILPGDGTKTGSYVHVDDVAYGHILAMQKGRNGERYILSGENVSYNEFFEVLAEVSGKKQKLIPFPVWLMLLSGYGMMAYSFVTGKPPLLTPKWIKKYNYNWSLDCSKAQQELGYTYRPLKQGLAETVAWLRTQQK